MMAFLIRKLSKPSEQKSLRDDIGRKVNKNGGRAVMKELKSMPFAKIEPWAEAQANARMLELMAKDREPVGTLHELVNGLLECNC